MPFPPSLWSLSIFLFLRSSSFLKLTFDLISTLKSILDLESIPKCLVYVVGGSSGPPKASVVVYSHMLHTVSIKILISMSQVNEVVFSSMDPM